MAEARNNRERIIDAALELFNEKGSHAVTTNQIAESAEISVGNLYYHFKNKQAVIRELFERLNRAWDERLRLGHEGLPTLGDVERLIREQFEILWEYRFFYREQSALRQNDKVMARRWVESHRRGRSDMAQMLVALGVKSDAIEESVDLCWIVSDYWLAYQESCGGKLSKSGLERGVKLFRGLVMRLTEKG